MDAIKFNTYIGLAAATTLYGENGLVMAALVIAVLVPLVNALSVLVLITAVPNGGPRGFLATFCYPLSTNPFIIACVVGLFIRLSTWRLASSIASVISALGQAALPLGLLAVGAGLNTLPGRSAKLAIIWCSALKLIVMPVITILTCNLLHVTGPSAQVAVLFAALPSASTAYVLALQMGGHTALMATIITVTNLVAVVTMPLFAKSLEITTMLAQ